MFIVQMCRYVFISCNATVWVAPEDFDYFAFQMIIAVSQLIGDVGIISESRFTESLSIISSYASNDKAVQV